MNLIQKWPTVFTLLVSTLTPALAQNPGSSGDTSTTRRPYGNYEARLYLDRTQYPGNRAVAITMTLTNLSRQRAVITPGHNRVYDYLVRELRSNQIVYQRSRHPFTINNSNFALNPGETRTYRELWDQRDDAGNRVPGGTYVLEAHIFPQSAVSTQFFLAGPGNGGGGQPQPEPENPGNLVPPQKPIPPVGPGDMVTATLTLDKTRVQSGQTVQVTYTVTAPAHATAPIQFRFSSGKQFDVVISNPRGRVIWTASQNKMYTQAITEIELKPGESRVFRETWTVPANAMTGTYRIVSYLVPMGNQRGVAIAMTNVQVIIQGARIPGERGDQRYRPD